MFFDSYVIDSNSTCLVFKAKRLVHIQSSLNPIQSRYISPKDDSMSDASKETMSDAFTSSQAEKYISTKFAKILSTNIQ